MQQAREAGLLGENILGSGFSFDVKINRGGGAFVCGESSALFASLEGRAGEPRAKYIHATHKGLYDKPTNLNNVETWAQRPVHHRARAPTGTPSIGTENSKGTKIFSLVGKINNTGLVEVPMGMTLREIVFDIGGGIPDGTEVQGDPDGRALGRLHPEKHLDMRVDFDELTKIGSMMGSGGMIVMDERNCMVDVARYFMNFLVSGILRQVRSLPGRHPADARHPGGHHRRQRSGRGRGASGIDVQGDPATAPCAPWAAAPPIPVLSTIRYFRDEYVAHIKEKRCPAGVCKDLITYSVDPDKCTGCTVCSKVCPTGAASGERKQVHKIDQAKCTKCGACRESCKFDAIIVR